MIVRGGRAIYGESIGILVLDSTFPRIPGDAGNATTFGFPVRYKTVRGATVGQVVAAADKARVLLPLFIDAARELESEGVRAIATTCGFLSVVQDEIAAAVDVPVVTSSLFLVPLIRRMLGPRRTIGIVTADSDSLSSDHLRAAGIDPEWLLTIRGLEDSTPFRSILDAGAGDCPLDVEAVRDDVAALCGRMRADAPGLGAIVFECTNLQPYAQAAQAAAGCPVFGIYHLVNMLHGAVVAPGFSQGYL